MLPTAAGFGSRVPSMARRQAITRRPAIRRCTIALPTSQLLEKPGNRATRLVLRAPERAHLPRPDGVLCFDSLDLRKRRSPCSLRLELQGVGMGKPFIAFRKWSGRGIGRI